MDLPIIVNNCNIAQESDTLKNNAAQRNDIDKRNSIMYALSQYNF